MRTKYCRLIGEAICWATQKIRITEKGMFLGEYTDTQQTLGIYSDSVFWPCTLEMQDSFAWKDGFRPEGSTADDPAGAWELMLRFWKQTHDLPFSGVVIYWKDFKTAIK